MMQRLSRLLRIAQLQFRNLPVNVFFLLLVKSLFKEERILIYGKDLSKDITPSQGDDFHELIFKGELSELEKIRENMVSPPWEYCCHIHDGVRDFFVYKDNEKIGHISWIYYRNNPNRIMNLSTKQCEIKFCLTLPEHRGRGIYPAVLSKIQNYLKQKGYAKVFICVKDGNIPSITGIEKVGFSLIAQTKLIKIMGVQLNKRYSFHESE